MAEEDLIFGKNRHFFGGIEPSKMLGFVVSNSYDASTDSARVRIVAKLPKETTIDGQTLCSVSGAVIRKKTGSYPTDEFDGTQVMTIEKNGIYYDEDVTLGETYYYAAFPFTGQGVYNRSPLNRAVVNVVKCSYFYGYDLDTNDSNPSTRVVYPSSVDNATFEPAAMDFTADTFNYGGWTLAPGEAFMPKPCMLKYDGTVDYYLDPNNYAKREDGATDSDISNTAYEGNAMMEWAKIFTKRWEDENGIYHFRCADQPLDDEYDCWCNYDKNDDQIDHFYTAIYVGQVVNSKLRSLTAAIAYKGLGTTGANELTYAKANGDDWCIEVLADRMLINDLLVMMAKTTDCQTAYGTGQSSYNVYTTSPTSTIGNVILKIHRGTADTNGLFWGAKTIEQYYYSFAGNSDSSGYTVVLQRYAGPVKVFGMEDYWGACHHRIAGWTYINNVQNVKLTRGTHDGSVVTDYNTTGSGYIAIADSTVSGTSGGFISDMKTMPYGRFPIKASGSSTTYECDAVTFSSGAYMAVVNGGQFFNASGSRGTSTYIGNKDYATGIFTAILDLLPTKTLRNTYSVPDIIASLSCKPTLHKETEETDDIIV